MLRETVEKMKFSWLLLLLLPGALACIGNPYGVSLDLYETVDYEQARDFCGMHSQCRENGEYILYVSPHGIAVTVSPNSVDAQIPLDEQGKPVKNFSDWQAVYEEELTQLKNNGVLNLTSQDVQNILDSGLLHSGAILAYSPGVGGISQARTFIANASAGGVTAVADSAPSTCSGPTITRAMLPPKKEFENAPEPTQEETYNPVQDALNIIAPLTGISQSAAPGESPILKKETEDNVLKKETPSHQTRSFSPLDYWWTPIALAVFLGVTLIVFKLSLGGEETTEMSVEDLGVLTAPRRIEMMKSLSQRRKTLTEISKEEGISLPTTKEHLEKLEGRGFIKKIDTGHKWKYYELTRKGKKIMDSAEFENN
jgi:predicted transcriptional regulator